VHPTSVEVNSFPSTGRNLTIFSFAKNLNQTVKNVSIEILAQTLTFLQNLLPTTLTNEDNIMALSVNFIVPNVPFRLKLNAHLDNNEQIQRFNPKVYIPTTIQTTLSSNQSAKVNIGDTFAFEIRVKALGSNLNAVVLVKDTLGFLFYEKTTLINTDASFVMELNLTIPNNDTFYGQTNTITLSANELNSLDNLNFRSIDISIQSANVSFELQPRCVVLDDTRRLKCSDVCDRNSYWNAHLAINETGSGLASINTVHTKPLSSVSTFNLTSSGFVFGSKNLTSISIRADCCTQDFVVLASDIYGNVGSCSFQSPQPVQLTTPGIEFNKSATRKFLIADVCSVVLFSLFGIFAF